MIVVFLLYGFYTALVASAEKAFMTEIAPDYLRGTILGLHASLTGLALLPASLIAGGLWHAVGAWAPCIFGSILSFFSVVILITRLK